MSALPSCPDNDTNIARAQLARELRRSANAGPLDVWAPYVRMADDLLAGRIVCECPARRRMTASLTRGSIVDTTDRAGWVSQADAEAMVQHVEALLSDLRAAYEISRAQIHAIRHDFHDLGAKLARLRESYAMACDTANRIEAERNRARDIAAQLEAELAAVTALHRPITVPCIMDDACINDECDCEGQHPTEFFAVCAECLRVSEDTYPYALEGGGVGIVAWPCATARAVGCDGEEMPATGSPAPICLCGHSVHDHTGDVCDYAEECLCLQLSDSALLDEAIREQVARNIAGGA